MIKVKDGYAKLVGTTASGSASHILLSNGGVKAVSDFATASALDNYLPLSGGTMLGPITFSKSSGGNLKNNYLSAGGGFGTGSGRLGLKLVAIDLEDILSGLGIDLTGFTYETCLTTGRKQDDVESYITFATHNSDDNIYKRLGYFKASGSVNPVITFSVDGIIDGTGFKKTGSSNSYILLGGGDHKAISDFAPASHGVHWEGFTKRAASSATWGTLTSDNGYTPLFWLDSTSSGGVAFSDKGGQTFMQIDGYFYQNEGKYLVLDTNNYSATLDTRYYTESEVNTLLGKYLPLTGGTLTNDNNILNLLGTTNSYIYYTIGSTRKASTGYYNNFAFLASESGSYARIGVADDGTPLYHTDNKKTNVYTLLHSGNYKNLITDLYWANIKVSNVSNTTTTPTFGKIKTAGIENTGHYSWLANTNFKCIPTANNHEWSFDLGNIAYDNSNNSSYTGTYLQIWSVKHGATIASFHNDTRYVGINTTAPSFPLHINGDSYASGWSRAANGFYIHDTGVHFTRHNVYTVGGEINLTSGNEFMWGANTAELYFNYRAVSRGTTVTSFIWNAGSATTYANHTLGSLTSKGNLTMTSGYIWVLGGSATGGNSNRLTTTTGMPGNMLYNVSRRGTLIYSNGIAFADPYNGNNNNDSGWIRHIETTANTSILEIATGDDGDASEEIRFRGYNTSNTINYDILVPKASGTLALVGQSYTKSEADSRFVNYTGDTMTGVLTMNTGTGFQMKYTSNGNDPWMYPNGAPNYGIRYFESTVDKMALSASGNNNNITTADLCINGNGDGTVTIRGNTIWHAGNDGSGSGLDADLLDGYHRSNLYASSEAWFGAVGLTKSITVAGDSAYWYPVVITCSADKQRPTFISIWKNLGTTTPSISGNHSNGTSSLWLQYEMRNPYWDGNGGYIKTWYKYQGYGTLVAHTRPNTSATGLLIVWLRGGTCLYNISCTNSFSVNIYYSSTNITGSSTYTDYVDKMSSVDNGGIYSSVYLGYGNISGSASSATYARYVIGDNNAASPGHSLLQSGSGRADASPGGDTWIYWDTLGGTASPWGILHEQYSNYISFYGAGNRRSFINLSDGCVYGAHFYENSDIRYKTIINNLAIKANQLANLPLFDFKWLDNEDLLNTGTSAQAVQELLPYIVSGTDKLTLDYGVLGTIAGITACKELTEQEKEINELKEQIKFLKDEINNLKTNKLWQS